VHDALEKGYLINLSPNPKHFDLDIGDPLPAEGDLLPKTEDLERAFARRSATVRPPTERSKPASEEGLREGVRSVRPISDGEGEEAPEWAERLQGKYGDANDRDGAA
jgi:hypothetical protein